MLIARRSSDETRGDRRTSRLRWPMKSKTASPAFSSVEPASRHCSGLLRRGRGRGGRRLGRGPAGRAVAAVMALRSCRRRAARPAMPLRPATAEAGDPRRHERLAAGEQRDDRVGEQEDDHQVEDRRHAEGEREALHVAGGEVVEDRRGEEARPRRRTGSSAGPAPRPAAPRTAASALADLVLQSFEEHDERVGCDADRDDEPGDAGQGQGEADLPAEDAPAPRRPGRRTGSGWRS